ELGRRGGAETAARVVQPQVVDQGGRERVSVGEHRLAGRNVLGAVGGGADGRALRLDDGGDGVAAGDAVRLADGVVDLDGVALLVLGEQTWRDDVRNQAVAIEVIRARGNDVLQRFHRRGIEHRLGDDVAGERREG